MLFEHGVVSDHSPMMLLELDLNHAAGGQEGQLIGVEWGGASMPPDLSTAAVLRG